MPVHARHRPCVELAPCTSHADVARPSTFTSQRRLKPDQGSSAPTIAAMRRCPGCLFLYFQARKPIPDGKLTFLYGCMPEFYLLNARGWIPGWLGIKWHGKCICPDYERRVHVRQVHLYKSLTVRDCVGCGSAGPGTDSAPSGGAQGSRGSRAASASVPDTLSASPCSTPSQPRDLFETWMILGDALPSPCPLPRCLQVNHGLGY